MRRASTCLALLGLAVLGLSATASAAPTVTMKAEAVPIPGFPGTGNILGAGTALQTHFTISGTEYGGFPPPLIGVKFYAPAAKLTTAGFATCTPTTLEQSGPSRCPKGSQAGPKGSASGVVSFGAERVAETVSVQPFFSPGGVLSFFVDGTTPVSIEILSKGKVLTSAPAPFGTTFEAEVPLIETVPGALDASAKEINVKVGAAFKKGKKVTSYVTVPKKCPKGGFPFKVIMSFYGGATAEATDNAPCPKR